MTKNTPRIFISLLLMLLCIGILPGFRLCQRR